MRRIVMIILLCIISFQVFGQQAVAESLWVDALSAYKPIYFITGLGDDQVKVRVSFKFDVFHPRKIGLYFGFTIYRDRF